MWLVGFRSCSVATLNLLLLVALLVESWLLVRALDEVQPYHDTGHSILRTANYHNLISWWQSIWLATNESILETQEHSMPHCAQLKEIHYIVYMKRCRQFLCRRRGRGASTNHTISYSFQLYTTFWCLTYSRRAQTNDWTFNFNTGTMLPTTLQFRML